MSVLLTSSNNYISVTVNTHCLRLNIDWLNSPLIVTHSRTGVNRAKANSITRWSPTWNWSYSKTLIYIPYKTLPDSEGLLGFSYLSQLLRKSLSSVSISVIHMWLISFEENSGDQNCHHFNDSKMNNVPNKHYEHYKPQFFFHVSAQAFRSWICFPKYIGFDQRHIFNTV